MIDKNEDERETAEEVDPKVASACLKRGRLNMDALQLGVRRLT